MLVADHHEFFDGATQALGDDKRLRFAGLRQVEAELFPAKAGEAIALSEVLPHQIGKGDQRLVAGLVAIAIVDALEEVQIHDDEAVAMPV
ncbi:hypothetical protein D9M68_468240 [compost metagenome]